MAGRCRRIGRLGFGASMITSASPTGSSRAEMDCGVVPYQAAVAVFFHPCFHLSLGAGPILSEVTLSAEGIPEGADS